MELHSQAKKQKILTPAEKINNSIDFLTEILVKLQVKHLVRFKCVSKHWLSLISDPQFCVSHTRHHQTPYPTPTALLLKNSFISNHKFEIVPLKHHTIPKVTFFHYLKAYRHPISIRQSCNGLLLYAVPLFGYKDYVRYRYYICNPTAKKLKKIPFPSLEFHESLISVCMAFDPLKSSYYKIICVRKVHEKEKYQIDKYSSETDCWVPLGITFTPPYPMEFYSAVFTDGAVHWLSQGQTSLYFDVDRECLNTMPMPNLGRGLLRYFGESRGHLHVIVTEYIYGLQFDVLEMAVDYSGWFVRYHVNLHAVMIAFPHIIWYREGRSRFSVLHVIRAQKEEESVVVVCVDNKSISFNVHNGMSKKLLDLEHPVKDDYTWWSTFPYFEILTSV